MKEHLYFRRAARFSMAALAMSSGLFAVSLAFANEPSAKPEAAAPPDKGTGATITFDKLELKLVADKEGDKANDAAPPKIIINGKVVSPEEAAKIIKASLKDKEKQPENSGQANHKLEISSGDKVMALPDGRVLIVNEAKGNDAKRVQEWPVAVPPEGQGTFSIHFTAKMSDYFLGLECFLADEALRAQLNLPEHQGLIVEQVVPDSPAAKAEIKRFDVLLAANDKKLGEVSDLTAIVEEAKGNDIALKLLRGGKEQTITVKPAKRPKPEAGEIKIIRTPTDQKAVEEGLKYLIKARAVEEVVDSGKGNVQFSVVGPGMAVPSTTKLAELPDDMSVTITRKGKSPAHIVVQKGDEKWETTEKDLDKLPEKIRGFIGPLVGRYDLLRFRTPADGGTWERPVVKPFPGPGTDAGATVKKPDVHNLIIKAEAVPGEAKPGMNKGLEGAIDKRFEMMQRQIEELREMNSRLPAAIHEAMTAMKRQMDEVREEARAGGDKRREEFRQREQQIREEYEQKIRELKKSLDTSGSKAKELEKGRN